MMKYALADRIRSTHLKSVADVNKLAVRGGALLRLSLLAGTALLTGWSDVVRAQNLIASQADQIAQVSPSGSQTAATPTNTDAIPEVSVTARRRSELLQNVPVSVSVINADQAKLFNQNDIQDILQSVPSANFKAEASNKDRTIVVRGIGTFTTAQSAEPSVSTVVDGVVLARSGQASADFISLDQVEVLRGPQGTLFGRNAAAGVINITTPNPTAQAHEWLAADYFSGGDEIRLAGGVSGALVDNRLNGLFSVVLGHYNGNVQNLYLGNGVNGYDREGFRTKLQFTPSDNVDVTLAFDYLRSYDTTPKYGPYVSVTNVGFPSGVQTAPNAVLLRYLNAAGISASSDSAQVINDTLTRVYDDNGGASGTVNWRLGDHELTSITAYRRWRNVQFQDTDNLAPVFAPTPAKPGVNQSTDRGDVDLQQISEELRVASPKGQLIDYVGGLYYMHIQDDEDYSRKLYLTSTGSTTAGTAYGINNFSDTANDVALFGEANINFTDSLRAILGLRVIHDDLSSSLNRVTTPAAGGAGVRPSFASSGSTDNFGYSDRLGLQYDVTKNVTTYFTYSRGYLGPAYNLYFNQFKAAEAAPLTPETSDAYEVGVKTTFLDNRARVNVAGFLQKFEHYQTNLTQFVGGVPVSDLIDAGKVSTRGIEYESEFRPIHGASINLNAAYTYARIDQFGFNGPTPAAAYNGQRLPYAPNWKVNVGGSYELPISDNYSLAFHTQFNWQSSTLYQLTQQPDTIQPAYGIWDGTVTLYNSESNWQVSGLLKNLLDQHYAASLAEINGGVARVVPRDDGRYFGISVRKDF
jgi:iron complex outermembrane receptor protein